MHDSISLHISSALDYIRNHDLLTSNHHCIPPHNSHDELFPRWIDGIPPREPQSCKNNVICDDHNKSNMLSLDNSQTQPNKNNLPHGDTLVTPRILNEKRTLKDMCMNAK